MADIAKHEQKMNEMIEGGDILEAFEEYTAEDVVFTDQVQGENWEGKEACRDHEHEFLNFVETVHNVELHDWAVNEDDGVSFSEWTFHVTFKNGEEMNRRQIERRQWRDGKVVDVRFF